jgi:membrane protein implicated in regulation of membrane protease activity
MSDSSFATIWLVGGVALMLAELLLPGGIVGFLGLGATLVATLLFFGVIHGPAQAFAVWFIGSVALLFGLRGFVPRFLGSSVERTSTNEDLDAYDQVVEVAEAIPAEGEGRVHFRGTTWKARSHGADRELSKGGKVRLIARENLIWVVEASEEDASDQ